MPLSEQELAIFVEEIHVAIDVESGFPAWPFRSRKGHIDAFEFSMLFDWDFPAVMQALALTYGDRYVTFMALDYHGDPVGPIWRIKVSANMSGPYGYVHYRKDDSNPNRTKASVHIESERIAIVGSSGRWSIWAERAWDLGLLLSETDKGAWLQQTFIPFADPVTALDEFTVPGYSGPSTDEERSAFLRSLREHGAASDDE